MTQNKYWNCTVKDWLERWLSEWMLAKKWATVKGYQAQCRANISPYIGDIPICELGIEDVNRLYKTLNEKGLSPKSIRNVHGIAPLMAGWAIFALLMPLIGAGWFYAALLLWGVLWAFLEHLAPNGYPKHRIRLLTPNFFAVQDFAGCWRIFQRRPEHIEDCRLLLKGLLEDQRRLPAALIPGSYRALTHDTILDRLKRMDNVAILSIAPVYVTKLENTIGRAVNGRCRHCMNHCPFQGKQKPRQFYDIRFLVS